MDIDDAHLRAHLNLAIYLINPKEKWPAHVTIAGPFDRSVDVPRSLTFLQQVYLLGRGRFDDPPYHTIFLHVGSRDMTSRMNKPDYPGAVPHLTLYSGRNKETADLLYNKLENVNLFGTVQTKQLRVVETSKQITFGLRLDVDPSILPFKHAVTLDELEALAVAQRIDLAVTALQIGFLRPKKVFSELTGRK